MKLAVIFGGMSTEHEVSIVSGTSVIKNLDKCKYEITPIYIDKNGVWYEYVKNIDKIEVAKIDEKLVDLKKVDNIFEMLKKQDMVFPILHGKYGEDGTIQGFLEILKIPYIGCKVLSSSIAMDKVYTKVLMEKANIKQVRAEYIKKCKDKYIFIDKNFDEEKCTLDDVIKRVEKNLDYPMFVKPSNSGSSVGITKAKNVNELKNGIENACKYDNKVLIEQGIEGKEVECAVLGNEEVIASAVGEVKPAEEFYSFDAKYKNENSKTIIPAEITEKQAEKVKELAIKAFKVIDGKGLARVDFFIEEKTEKIYLNEINTMPGFTESSMYPKLFENVRSKIF